MMTPVARWWRLAWWLLFAAFLLTAALNMTGVSAGFATNYLADLVGPAWLYVSFRGLASPGHASSRVRHALGASPERTAAILFVASTATEITQRYWPTGIFRGHFDPLDIAAFGLGLLPVYLGDRMTLKTANGAVANIAGPAA